MIRIAALALVTALLTGCAVFRAGFVDPYDPPGRGGGAAPRTCGPGAIPGTIDCV